MSFMEAVKTCFARFLVIFKGRSRRSEYWFTILLYFIVLLVALAGGVICAILFEDWEAIAAFWFFLAAFAAEIIAIPLFPASWRRMHDVGKPGWLLIIDYPFAFLLAPCILLLATAEPNDPAAVIEIALAVFAVLDFVYRIILLVLLCKDGNPYTNKYGPDPKGRGLDRPMVLTEANPLADTAASEGQNAGEEAANPYAFGENLVPPERESVGKAGKDKGHLALTIVLGVFVILLSAWLMVSSSFGIARKAEVEDMIASNEELLAENEALQGKISVLEQNGDRYENLQQHLQSGSNPCFFPSEYVFVMNPGERESFTLYCLYDEAATIYTEQYGEAAEYAFTEDEWEWSTEIMLTAESAGITEINFTNTANDDAFSVIVLVLEE